VWLRAFAKKCWFFGDEIEKMTAGAIMPVYSTELCMLAQSMEQWISVQH